MREDSREITPIFGLTKPKLQSIVDGIFGKPISSFSITVRSEIGAEHYGFSAEKLIPTFTHTLRSGRKEAVTVFAKRFHEAVQEREAMHYRVLTSLGAPVPILYGSIIGPDQREIIFLEHIDPVPDYRPYEHFVKDDSKFVQFLKVTARLDALRPPDGYAAKIGSWSPHESYNNSAEFCFETFDRFWDDARAGKLGDDLKQICAKPALDTLHRLPERLAAIEFPPPTCINHDCYEPCHTGWRRETGEMLIFDLQGIALAPRFANVCTNFCLGAPDELLCRSRPRRELARIYLDEYVRCGGEPVSLEQFLTEVNNQWLCEAICLLDRWREHALTENIYRDMLSRLVRCLLRASF